MKRPDRVRHGHIRISDKGNTRITKERLSAYRKSHRISSLKASKSTVQYPPQSPAIISRSKPDKSAPAGDSAKAKNRQAAPITSSAARLASSNQSQAPVTSIKVGQEKQTIDPINDRQTIRIHKNARTSILNRPTSPKVTLQKQQRADVKHTQSEAPASSEKAFENTEYSVTLSERTPRTAAQKPSKRTSESIPASQRKQLSNKTDHRKISRRENDPFKSSEKPTIGQQVGSTVRQGSKTIAKEAAAAPIRIHKRAAEIALEEGGKSTGFQESNDTSPNAQASSLVAAGYKKITDPDLSIGAAKRVISAPKQIKRTSIGIKQGARAVQTSAKGISRSAHGMTVAVQNFRKAQYINKIVAQTQGKAAVSTAKNITELAGELAANAAAMLFHTIKMIANSGNLIYIAITFVVIILIVVFTFVGILTSGYGIFFSTEADNESSIQEIVRNVNKDYIKRTEELIEEYDSNNISLIRYEGSRISWKYVLAVYSVKYSYQGDSVITVDSTTEKRIKDVFYKIHTLSAYYTEQESPYKEGDIWNVLVIETQALTISQIMDIYGFDEAQRSAVADLISADTDQMWNNLIYGHAGNGGYAIAEIAKQQIGQPPQTYATWYGLKNTNGIDWSCAFNAWCANEAGYVVQGLYPRTNDAQVAMAWFKDRGLWDNPDKQPSVGDTIFLDFHESGKCELTGIITEIKGSKITYVSPDYPVLDLVAEMHIDTANFNNRIIGYGILPQMSGLRGDTAEEQIYHYLRQDGYSDIAACAVLANFQGECSCDPSIFSRDQGDAAGLMMWTDNGQVSNKTYFKNWCDDNALDWRNLESQLMFYDHWVGEVNSGVWGQKTHTYHINIHSITSLEEFKAFSAADCDGNEAQALYEATAYFVDDLERPLYLSDAEHRRYTYAVQFYNIFTGAAVDGSSIKFAWQPAHASDIGIFHLMD